MQDLVLRARVIRYRRERWMTPDGQTVLAPLPAGIGGHFGPELRRFVLVQHHQGQVTVERLTAQLRAIGISISKRQVMRLLIDRQDDFLAESRDVLRAGLQTAAWITVDDTGARHAGAQRLLHADRQRRLHLVRHAGEQEPAQLPRSAARRPQRLRHQRGGAGPTCASRSLAGPVISRLAAQPERPFRRPRGLAGASAASRASADLQVTPDPVRIATEGALWGAVTAHGFLREAVIVSDDAGQFAVGQHALCWVHAERLVHKLDTFTDLHRCSATIRVNARDNLDEWIDRASERIIVAVDAAGNT